MNILITGGSGRLGQYIVSRLEKEHTIRNLDLADVYEGKHEYVHGDVTSLDDMIRATRGMDAVVHLAGIPRLTDDTEGIFKINVAGVFCVLEACARNNVRKVVLASSVCAGGFIFWQHPVTPEYFPVDENHPVHPDDAYGLSKLLAEQMCQAYTKRYEIDTVCLRIATVWFPDYKATEDLIELLSGENADAHPRLKDCKWQYVDARDVAQAFELALIRSPGGFRIYNVGAATVPTERTALELVRYYYPDVKCIRNASGLAVTCDGALFDISLAQRELGYSPEFSWRGRLK